MKNKRELRTQIDLLLETYISIFDHLSAVHTYEEVLFESQPDLDLARYMKRLLDLEHSSFLETAERCLTIITNSTGHDHCEVLSKKAAELLEAVHEAQCGPLEPILEKYCNKDQK